MLDQTNTYATDIFNLEIGGIFYDVHFEFIDGTETPISVMAEDVFFEDPSGAQAAVTAIANELNSQGVNRAGQGISGSGGTAIVVIYSDTNDQSNIACQDLCVYRSSSLVGTFGTALDGDLVDTAEVDIARFTVSEVPVPPALYLFLSGLVMLGWRRRERAG